MGAWDVYGGVAECREAPPRIFSRILEFSALPEVPVVPESRMVGNSGKSEDSGDSGHRKGCPSDPEARFSLISHRFWRRLSAFLEDISREQLDEKHGRPNTCFY